jgi:DNA-binding GntR family transcriptional regulator
VSDAVGSFEAEGQARSAALGRPRPKASSLVSRPTEGARNSPEVIAEELRRAILRGELAPGEHVRQPEWSNRLGVSRPVLREAFKILTGQRLLRHSPQAGYFVVKLNTGEMRQLYQIRMFIEEQILRTIRWPTEDEIEELGDLFAQYRSLFLAGDVTAAVDCWREYTERIFSLSPLKLMISEAMRLWEMASPYRMVGLTTQLIRDPELLSIEEVRQAELAAFREHDLDALIKSFVHKRTATTDAAMLSLFGSRTF